MADTAYGWSHQKARKAAKAALREGTPCPFCGQPMFRSQRLDYDHETPIVLGGDPHGPRRLSHASCNRAAGARLGNARRTYRPRRPAARRTASTFNSQVW